MATTQTLSPAARLYLLALALSPQITDQDARQIMDGAWTPPPRTAPPTRRKGRG